MLKPGQPRHEQISDWLRVQIQEGVYAADAQIPSESQLTERFEVSRITVRRALQTLENEGLIYRRQGLGSFVKDTRVRQGLVRLTAVCATLYAVPSGLEESWQYSLVAFDGIIGLTYIIGMMRITGQSPLGLLQCRTA